MKDELLPQSTKGMDLFLANLTAKCNNEIFNIVFVHLYLVTVTKVFRLFLNYNPFKTVF